MRPVLVAGSSGQLARCLVEAARLRGAALLAIGRPELDLEDAASIERAVRTVEPAAIVNAAAYTAVDRAESEAARAFAVNRDGAERLALAAQERGVPFIHVSTDYVFDGRKPSPYTEEDAPAPLNVYGRSKLEGEAAVHRAHAAALVLRTSWVYSPYGRNFVTAMLSRAGPEQTENIRVVEDQHGAPTAAADLAGAILDILRLDGRDIAARSGIYHLAARGETTWHGLASVVFARLGRAGCRVPKLVAISSAQYPAAALRPANSRLDCAKIERRFKISLPHWRQSLDRCLDRLLVRAEPQGC